MPKSKKTQIDPDEECKVCSLPRVLHGDSHHQFSTDGQLRVKPEPPKPKQEAPRLKPENADRDQLIGDMKKSIEANAVMRLVEVLAEKELLSTLEVMYIFSGHKPNANQE